jgi:hypothetical protein
MLNESFGRVFNASGEIVAEGSCSLDLESGRVTLHPVFDNALLPREPGQLRLVLDDASEYLLKKGVIRFRLNVPGAPIGNAYRMFIANQLPSSELPRSGTES